MIYRVVVKWLLIVTTVLVGFLVVLLLLGYLLKVNEVATTQLKAKLEQEAYQQQERNNRRKDLLVPVLNTLSAFEKSQQKVIVENHSCQTDKQCFLVHTHSQAIGCMVAVNTLGATILLKVASANKNTLLSSSYCDLEYKKKSELIAQCRNEHCTLLIDK